MHRMPDSLEGGARERRGAGCVEDQRHGRMRHTPAKPITGARQSRLCLQISAAIQRVKLQICLRGKVGMGQV